jgi:lysophospholipase L1-like esterase
MSLPAAPTGLLVFDGDSVAAGMGATPGFKLEDGVKARLGWAGRVVNFGQPGLPLALCLGRYPDTVGALATSPAVNRILVIHAGDNDISQGSTASQTYDAFTRYVALAHRDGWIVVASTELARPTFSAAQQAELSSYNRLILENGAGADAVADFEGEPGFHDLGNRASPAYFAPDQVHPSDAGYAILARLIADAVTPLLR